MAGFRIDREMGSASGRTDCGNHRLAEKRRHRGVQLAMESTIRLPRFDIKSQPLPRLSGELPFFDFDSPLRSRPFQGLSEELPSHGTSQDMNKIATALFALSALWGVLAVKAEITGTVTVSSSRSLPKTYAKADSPAEFRHAMTFYWIRFPLPGLAGFFLLWLIRRQDRLDPSSPHFQGSAALDELGEHLDKELEKRRN